jgi:hypothetical protein
MESTLRRKPESLSNIENSGFPSLQSNELKAARFFRITFPESGKPVLNIGPGDHTVQRWNLTMEDLKGLVKDCLPELLR